MARAPDEPICPSCGVRVRVPPKPGEDCADCQSARAWSDYGSSGRKLVLDTSAFAEVEARRAGEAAGIPRWRRALRYAPAVVAGLLGAVAAILLAGLFSPRPLASVADVFGSWKHDGWRAAGAGAAALAAGTVALLHARRSAIFRSWAAAAASAAAATAGLLAVATGLLNVWAASVEWGWRHNAAPPVPASPATPITERIMRATVVIFATDEDGDARNGVMGAGAVIRTEARRAWIVTCSHVAMHYIDPAAFRDPATAPPLWVHLADGRSAAGRVQWTAPPPLDIAVVSMDIDNPPPSIDVARDDDDVSAGGETQFVPNPFRAGWMLHRGSVTRREPHATAAGPYSLIYTDLPLQHGDSGSGLFDSRGQLIGVNTWSATEGMKPVGICLPAAALAGALDDAARRVGAGPTGQPLTDPEQEETPR